MWCAGCGKKLATKDYGGSIGVVKLRCCKDKGYWGLLAPLPKDVWALEAKVWREEIKAYLYLYRFPK